MAGKSMIFRFGDIEVREREFSLVKAGETLSVEPKAFRVLLILLRHPGKLISKEELLNSVWGDAAVTDNSLTRSIALLRRLLGDETRNPRYIETVATVGYRWVCKVEVAEEDSRVLKSTGETPGNATAADAAVISPEQADKGAGGKSTSAHRKEDGRKWLATWSLSTAAVLAVAIAAGIWYLHRPLPQLRISGYSQITHDGRKKDLVGTDGSRLYFNGSGIQQVAASGGTIAPVPVALPDPYLMDVSPDGSNLLVMRGGPSPDQSDFLVLDAPHTDWTAPLWNVRTLGGSIYPLADASYASWSPDGETVAYSTPADDIYLIRSDGTGARKLASVGGVANNIAWSPDGRILRFTKNLQLWEIASDGSNLHQLLPNWRASSQQCCGRWTRDGKFFIFLSGGSLLSGAELWAIDERRGLFREPSADPVELTAGPIHWRKPLPGKDFRTIFSGGTTFRGELSRFDSQSKQLRPFLGGISAEFVSFSKDGKALAYVSFPEGILWRANRDGSDPVQLSDPPIYAILPRWSPDGAQILFTDVSQLGDPGIYFVSSKGGRPQRLIPEKDEQVADPAWSPDGHKVAFSAGQIGGEDAKSTLRLLDMDSHQITTLPESTGLFSPRWSPDGRHIAALWHDSNGLSVFDVETQRWKALLHRGPANFPEWSKDSQSIFYIGDGGVFRIRVAGGVAERMVDLKEWPLTGVYTFWLGLDPTDAPLVLRDIGSDDIYALTLEEK